MSDYILRLYHCFTKLFLKEKQIKAESSSKYSTPPRKSTESASKYSTPLRVPSRAGSVNSRFSDVLPPQRATPIPKKVPLSCPIIRCPSQISVRRVGSEDDIAFRPNGNIRNRPFRNSSQKRGHQPFGCHIEADVAEGNAAKFQCVAEEFPRVPAFKSSDSSLDYFFMAGDSLEPTGKSCEKNFLKRQHNLRNNQYSHTGFPSKFYLPSSKIPIRNLNRYGPNFRQNLDFLTLPQRQRGRHTLPTQPLNLNYWSDLHGNDGPADNSCLKSSDIGNWIAYRNDTRARFERVFKALSKKKHTIGNLIDATSHSQWLQLTGIEVDPDASMFKQFAGGKVVLTCGEYKFLIDKICTLHELDYWDVLRRMSTFENEDLHEIEALLTSQ